MSNTCCQPFLNFFGCARSSLLCKLFSSCIEQRLLSKLQCMGCSWQWLLFLLARGHVGFSGCGTLVLEHRLSSCGARAQLLYGGGIFLDQGWNLCLLHWQVNSLPLTHQGSQLSIFWTQLRQNTATHLYGRKPRSMKTKDPWRKPTQGNLLQAPSLFESLCLSLRPLYPFMSPYLHALCFLIVAKL